MIEGEESQKRRVKRPGKLNFPDLRIYRKCSDFLALGLVRLLVSG